MSISGPPVRVQEFVTNRMGDQFWNQFLDAVLAGWRTNFRAIPTSWYRSPSVNAAAGGDAISQHLLGLAVDWEINRGRDHMTDPEALAFAAAMQRVGFTVEPEEDHVHTQTFPAGALQGVRFVF